jgi:hypothetical protein
MLPSDILGHYESETEWRAPATGKTKEAVTSGTCCQRELRCPSPCPSSAYGLK